MAIGARVVCSWMRARDALNYVRIVFGVLFNEIPTASLVWRAVGIQLNVVRSRAIGN